MNIKLKAFIILLTIPLLWGVTFPLMHIVLSNSSANLFVFWRFFVAGIILLPVLHLAILRKKAKPVDLKYGLIIGLINSGSFVFQGMALQHEDSARAAFITGINVVMVPLLLPLFAMGRPKVSELIAAFMCLIGIYVISDAKFTEISYGDLLVLLSSICIALGIILVEKASKVSQSLKLLTFYQIILTSLAPFMILKGHVINFPTGQLFWWSLVYCAIFATVIPIFLQLKYQPVLGSSKSAIIFSLEAVFATFFAWLFGEPISDNVILGGSIILFSAIMTDAYKMLCQARVKS